MLTLSPLLLIMAEIVYGSRFSSNSVTIRSSNVVAGLPCDGRRGEMLIWLSVNSYVTASDGFTLKPTRTATPSTVTVRGATSISETSPSTTMPVKLLSVLAFAVLVFSPRMASHVSCSSSALCMSSCAFSTSQPMRTFAVTVFSAPSLESLNCTPV